MKANELKKLKAEVKKEAEDALGKDFKKWLTWHNQHINALQNEINKYMDKMVKMEEDLIKGDYSTLRAERVSRYNPETLITNEALRY